MIVSKYFETNLTDSSLALMRGYASGINVYSGTPPDATTMDSFLDVFPSATYAASLLCSYALSSNNFSRHPVYQNGIYLSTPPPTVNAIASGVGTWGVLFVSSAMYIFDVSISGGTGVLQLDDTNYVAGNPNPIALFYVEFSGG